MVVGELREEMAEHERQAQDPEMVPVLQVRDVDFSYGNVEVLHHVGFEIRRGEVTALLGTNGAGSRHSCGSSQALAHRRVASFDSTGAR